VKHGESAHRYQGHPTEHDHQGTCKERYIEGPFQKLGCFGQALRDIRDGAHLPTPLMWLCLFAPVLSSNLTGAPRNIPNMWQTRVQPGPAAGGRSDMIDHLVGMLLT
jgi:hypothetical protein